MERTESTKQKLDFGVESFPVQLVFPHLHDRTRCLTNTFIYSLLCCCSILYHARRSSTFVDRHRRFWMLTQISHHPSIRILTDLSSCGCWRMITRMITSSSMLIFVSWASIVHDPRIVALISSLGRIQLSMFSWSYKVVILIHRQWNCNVWRSTKSLYYILTL